MNSIDFMDKLIMLYPVLKNSMSLYNKWIALYKDNELEKIYDYLYLNSPKYAPKPAELKQIADNLGIHKNYSIDNARYYYKCECGAIYSINSRGCPKCKKQIAATKCKLVKCDELPPNVIKLKYDCWKCPYKQDYKKAIGCVCDQWGRRTRQTPECRTCMCVECCKEEINNRFDRNHNI